MDGNPEKLVEDADALPRTAGFQDSELLLEHEVLKDKIPAATEEAEERSAPEEKHVERCGVITERSRRGGHHVIRFKGGENFGEGEGRKRQC